MALTKDQILQADDLPREKLHIPQWGGDVYVRTMTGTERDAFELSCKPDADGKPTSLDNFRARLAVLTVTDEQGNRIFADADAAALGKKSAAALDAILPVAQRLNGLTKKDVERLAKNS